MLRVRLVLREEVWASAGVQGAWVAYLFCPLKGCVRRVLYMLALYESTSTVTGPAASPKGFKRSKSAWRDDVETVDEQTKGGLMAEHKRANPFVYSYPSSNSNSG